MLPRHDPARGEAADGRAPISAAIGDRIYDLYFGTAAFLGEAAEYIRASGHLSGAQHQRLQHEASFGEALKPLTYLLGARSMVLHGTEGSNLELANILATVCLLALRIMANLASAGRAGVIVPEGVLFRGGLLGTVWVTGTLGIEYSSSELADAAYRVQDASVEPDQ